MFKNKKTEETTTKKVDQVEVINHSDKEFVEYLHKINGLLKYVTELDYIKDMLLGIDKQAEMIENIAASSEEMTASIEDISHFVADSSSKSNSSITIANDTIKEIEVAFNDLVSSFEESKQVQTTMEKVNVEAVKINDMVTVIKSVAEQTNLLALNASIEAARAGEHGRGFAVVAEEIRKLAENTQEQVESINSTVSNLTSELSNTSKAMIESNNHFEKGKSELNHAVDKFSTLRNDLQDINNAFIEISASIEEQTAASQEMSSAVMIVNDESKHLNTEIIKTGKSINNISNTVNKIRLEMIESAGPLDMNIQLELCLCDHLIWRWRVYNMILGNETLSESQVGTHQTCRLGKWANTTNFVNRDMISAVANMESPHADLHKHAKQAITAYNKGDQVTAEKLLSDIDNDSVKVIAEINRLQKTARKL